MNTDSSFSKEGTSLHEERKVAVVAVHGVADQRSEDSTRAIANLLLNLNPNDPDKALYTPFYESSLRIAVRPTEVESPSLPSSQPNRFRKFWRWLGLEERGESISDYLDARQSPALDKLAHDFILDQLRGHKDNKYKGKAVYETLQLEGKRRSTGDKPDTKVHIYEMYWADLSRLGTGFINIFGEFYQLLFHLGSLGRHAVDLARIENQASSGSKRWHKLVWEYYSETQARASRMLSMFIPILNLYLLIASLLGLPGKIPPQYLPLVTVGSLILLLTVAIGYIFWQKENISFPLWVALPIISILTAGGVAIVQSSLKDFWGGDYRLLALEWGAILAIAIWFVLIKPYSIRRPGVDNLARSLGIPLGVIATICLLTTSNSHEGITWASFRVIEVVYLALVICWGLFDILYLFALIFGFFAVKSTRNPAKKARAGRAARLARLSLVIPAILFLILTLVLWMALTQVGAWVFPDRELYTPFLVFKSQSYSYLDFARKLIVAAASPVSAIVLALIVIAILLAIWSLLPAVWTEIQHPSIDDRSRLSKRLGNWLSRGFWLTIGSADYLIAHLVVILFIVGGVWSFFLPSTTDVLTAQILAVAAGLLAASTTGLIAFGRRLDVLTLGFRNVLDIILDVDNYLRVHPQDDNPRSRIFARYTSLLRYLCRQDYDALVIVSHSQGTVITADLLRFLRRESDPALEKLAKLPIYLFTMGCPLRQLYSFGFPHLYHWVDSWGDSRIDRDPPLPKELGVEYWVNAFYSGDYVGRYLWGDESPQRWLQEEVLKNTQRREYCLGAGAHTHYWEITEIEVAKEIDNLIDENVTKH